MPTDLGTSMALANSMVAAMPSAFAQGSLQGVNFYGDHSRVNQLFAQQQFIQAQQKLKDDARYQQAVQFAMAREQHVVRHEQAHFSALGANAAGGINYGRSTLQIPMSNGTTKAISFINSGSVGVNFPKLNFGKQSASEPTSANRFAGIKAQLTAIAKGASAPGFGDMSAADKGVYTQALSMLAAVNQHFQQANQPKSVANSRENTAYQGVGSRFNTVG